MEFMNEYGLLVAIALPVLAIVAINVLLAIGGERGTLLLPSLKPYPAVQMPHQAMAAEPAAVVVVAPTRSAPSMYDEGFEEVDELLARRAA